MSALLAIAAHAGLPLIEKILSGRLGDANGRLAAEVLGAIAVRVGVPVDQLEAANEAKPGSVIDAMRVVEASVVPEQIALYVKEAEMQQQLIAAESEGPSWASAWRPLGMYMLGFLWLWNVVILHVANAVWKIALPPTPFDQLTQLSGLYMGLYMGGHTIKDLAEKWKEKT